MNGTPAELAAELLDAVNARDPARLEAFLDDRSEVVTGRSTHSGVEAIVAWATKGYDHLFRRYAIDEYRTDPGSDGCVLALGSVEYAWEDGGEAADSSPIAITVEVAGGRLRRLRLHDDQAAALTAFSS